MKKRSFALILTLLCSSFAFAQSYTPIPFIQNQWFKSNGTVAAGYKLCTYAAHTTTPAATYSTALGTSNTNPVTLDSAGRANVFLAASSYKFILYASGMGNTCNGSSVGAAVWSEDDIAGYSIATNLTSPLPIAQGGTGTTTGVRAPAGFGATGTPTCSVPGDIAYINYGGGAIQASGTAVISMFVPIAQTATRLYAAVLGAAVPASETATFVIQVGGVNSALTCSIIAGQSSCTDTTHSVSLAVGDVVTMKMTCAGGAASLTGATTGSLVLSQ